MVLSIPIIITARLHIPLRRKIAVCIILCLGIAATAVGLWRIIVLVQATMSKSQGADPTYHVGFCSSVIEVNVAIIAACGPSMKAISTRFRPRLLGSSPSSESDKSAYGAGPSSGTGFGSRISRFSHIFTKPTSRKRTSMYSTANGRGYPSAPPAAPVDWPRANVGSCDERFDLRKYTRGTDSSSMLYLTDDENHLGIIQTTDISVGYSIESVVGDGSSREGRVVNAESIV